MEGRGEHARARRARELDARLQVLAGAACVSQMRIICVCYAVSPGK